LECADRRRFGRWRPFVSGVATDRNRRKRWSGVTAGQPGWGACQVTALRKVELLHQCANKPRVWQYWNPYVNL